MRSSNNAYINIATPRIRIQNQKTRSYFQIWTTTISAAPSVKRYDQISKPEPQTIWPTIEFCCLNDQVHSYIYIYIYCLFIFFCYSNAKWLQNWARNWFVEIRAGIDQQLKENSGLDLLISQIGFIGGPNRDTRANGLKTKQTQCIKEETHQAMLVKLELWLLNPPNWFRTVIPRAWNPTMLPQWFVSHRNSAQGPMVSTETHICKCI
jgi:hypothetical protein